MPKLIFLSSFLFILFISGQCAPTKQNLQDDFSVEQVNNQNGILSFLRNLIANLISNLSNMLGGNSSQREIENGNPVTPKPIVNVLNTIVEALRSGNAQRLMESIIDQFNQLVGRIGRLYSSGIEREIYFVEKNGDINPNERLEVKNLVRKMRMTQDSIEQLAKKNETIELSAVEQKIDSIKSRLNEIWDKMKTMYSEYNIKSTNVSFILDRLDFIDPKQLSLTTSELQNQLNKLWKDLSRNLMQAVDRLDTNVRRFEQNLPDKNQIKTSFHNQTDQFKQNFNNFINRFRNSNLTKLNLIEHEEDVQLIGKRTDEKKFSHLNLVSDELNNLNYLINSTNSKKSLPLNRFLRNVDRLQFESEKLLKNDLKNLINRNNSKSAKLQMNEADEDNENSNENTSENSTPGSNKNSNENSNDNSDDNSDNNSRESDLNNTGIQLDLGDEPQLKKFTNMLRSQFNESINQFTNYWRNLGKRINSFKNNQTNFNPFSFYRPRNDYDAFYGSSHEDHLDYADYFNSNDC